MSAGSSGAAKQRGSKPKGAVRAKSGCYTCRIRRKKCDEKMNNEGSCQTCERLRLQCLGFGAKRPDWMREGNSVAEIREKIKTFLAQNGMIKGHSGTANLRSVGPLTPTQDPSGSADAMSPSSSSLPLSQSAAGPGTNSLSTPLSATSTLTPDDRSASPNSPPNSRMHHSHFAGDRTFPPSHVHPQDHYDHSLDASGIHRGGHGTGILDLSNGRPTPIRSQSMRTARHSGYGNSFGEATSGLGLISMGPLTTTNGNEPSNTNNHTLDSPYTHHIPQLSPDSPKPSRPADPMIGAYTSHSAQVAGPGYVSTGHHVTEEFSVNSGHMRPGGVGHAGIASGQTDHGYGHSNAYGPNQTAPSSSWAGDDTVRSATHQSQEHAMHQHQATYGWPPTGFPNTPAVPRNDLPPPSMQSSFGASYNFTNYAMDLAMNEADAFNAQQAPMTSMAVSGVDEGSMIPYYPTAPVTEVDFYVLPQEEQQRIYQDMAPLQVLQPALMDPLFADRADRSLVEHYLRHVRPVQYFFWEDRVADLLRGLAFSNEAVRNAICSVASVHIRRMREGSIQLRERTPLSPSRRLPLLLATDIPNVPEGDDGNTYYDRTQLVLRQTGPERLTEAEAMAGLQCISSFLFAGGVGGWDFFLDVACTWVDMVFKRFRHLAGDAYLLEELTKMKRESELMSFIIRTTMWFEVLASVTMVRKPKFLEVYQVLFADSARIVEADGQATRTEAEFSMLEVMGCDNLTFLALAEISALAAWKEEQIKNQTLSFVELQERKSKIEDHCLRALAEAEASIFRDGSALGTDSLKNRRRLTADIFRASARLYLHTVLSGDNPGVKEIRDGARDTIDALKRVPPEPKSLRCSVVRSVVFPLCLAGCMTDVATERATVKEFLEGEGGAGNCGSVVAVMETVWERRDAKRRGGRRTEEVAGNVSWRDVLRERGGGMPILLV